MMVQVAVVILNYNGRHFLEQYLPSLIEHSPVDSVIVADNASTDDSISYLQRAFPQVRCLHFKSNHGFAEGYNRALRQVQAEYYAIINSDMEVTADWLNPLLAFLDNHPGYAAVQPKIKSIEDRNKFEYAGAAGGFLDAWGYPYCRGRVFNTVEIDSGQYDDTCDVHWTTGACMVIRSEEFHKVGGFDPDFFAHMEEIDLCWRLRSEGKKLACVPASTVYHVGGGTLDKSSPRKTYLNFRNGLFLLIKNQPLPELLWKFPIRLVLDGIAALKIAIDTAPIHLLAILKAHIHFYISLPKTIAKRKKTSSSGKGSLILSYFVFKKRKFSEM